MNEKNNYWELYDDIDKVYGLDMWLYDYVITYTLNRNLTVSPCGRSAGTVPEPWPGLRC